jgi:hypothetical protein
VNALIFTGSLVSFLMFVPLLGQIRSGVAKQNILTWTLWMSLDVVLAASIISQGGTAWLLPVVYCIGNAVTISVIWGTGDRGEWTWFEAMVTFLTLASMVVWYFAGDAMATIASTSAIMIAGIPQLKDAWKKPHEMPVRVYLGYLVGSVLCVAGGADWSIKERFHSVAATMYGGAIIVLATRRVIR